MAQDITQKAARMMIDALADTRYNPNWLNVMIAEYADTNEHIQKAWWLTNVGYLYNRTLVNDLGLAANEWQVYACERSSRIVHQILDPEYRSLRGPLSRQGILPTHFTDLSNYDQ